jgi:hypothetical protein
MRKYNIRKRKRWVCPFFRDNLNLGEVLILFRKNFTRIHTLSSHGKFFPKPNLRIECSRRPEHHIGRHCCISRQSEGHTFGDNLVSESVTVTPSSVIEASIVLSFVSLWLVWVNVQLACALNNRHFVVPSIVCVEFVIYITLLHNQVHRDKISSFVNLSCHLKKHMNHRSMLWQLIVTRKLRGNATVRRGGLLSCLRV